MRAFCRFVARGAPELVGSPWTFLTTLALTLGWLALGPITSFSDTWLLVPSALASILALLLVVLLQHSQNRDTRALQLKLDEVIRAVDHGRTDLVQLERLPEEELERIESEFEELREREVSGRSRRRPPPGSAP